MKIISAKIPAVFFLLIIFTASCKTTQTATVGDLSIADFELEQGIYDQAFSLASSVNWRMKLSVPKIIPDEKYPLILALHWGGGGTNAYREYADCLAFRALDTLGSIIVAPSSDGLPWTQPINEKRLLDLLDVIIKQWPVDRKKVIVTGYSNGGIGSWSLAGKYPERFAAAIPIAGTYLPVKMKIPVHVIHGGKDELFAVSGVIDVVKKSSNKNSNIRFTKMDHFSHYMGCQYWLVLQKAGLEIAAEINLF